MCLGVLLDGTGGEFLPTAGGFVGGGNDGGDMIAGVQQGVELRNGKGGVPMNTMRRSFFSFMLRGFFSGKDTHWGCCSQKIGRKTRSA